MFTNINDALNWLYTQKKQNRRENLDRVKSCAEALDLIPSYKIVHLAGTNGKGSTAKTLSTILTLAGKKVGLFVSPFVIKFNERIQVNNEYIKDEEIINYINELYLFQNEYKEKYNDVIPFFELTFLMALKYFKDSNVEVGIIECGMGGRLDATNFLKSDLSIITNVGFDHMSVLGNTLEEIAYHKLGIAKENQTCLTCVTDDLKEYFDGYANENNINMIHIDELVSDIKISDKTYYNYNGVKYSSSLLGTYQAYNTSLAIQAAKIIDNSLSYDDIMKGLNNTFWPGRLELISESPKILIDGAHNIHGIDALVNTIKNLYQGKKINIVFTALHDKEYKKMIDSLNEITNKFYFTSINDLRATDINEFVNITRVNSEIISNFKECIDKAINDLNDEILIITGSLHFISMVREYLIK
jgi:dihydrofolate synthase/folylpolyglutamate synthase